MDNRLIEHYNSIKTYLSDSLNDVSAYDENGDFVCTSIPEESCVQCPILSKCGHKHNILHNPNISQKQYDVLENEAIVHVKYLINTDDDLSSDTLSPKSIAYTIQKITSIEGTTLGYLMIAKHHSGRQSKDEWLEETYNTQMKTIMVSKIITFKYSIVSQLITFFYQGEYTTIPFSQYGELMDSENLNMLTDYYKKLSDGTIQNCQFLLKICFPGTNEDRYFECRLDTENDENGTPVSILGVDIDVTEQHLRDIAVNEANKRLEKERLEQQRKEMEMHRIVSLALSAYGINVWKFDLNDNKFYSILACQDFFLDNKSYDEIAKILLSEGAPVYHRLCRELGSGVKERDNAILGILDPATGEHIYNRNAYITIKDDNGKVVSIIGASKDITEELKQSNELKKYEINVDLSNRIGNLNLWEYDLSTHTYESKNSHANFGRKPFKKEEFKKNAHPHDAHLVDYLFDQMDEHCSNINEIVIRLKYPDYDSYRYIAFIPAVVTDDLGNMIGYTGIKRDITDERRYQRKIEQMNASLSYVMFMGQIMPFIWSPNNDSFSVTSPEHRKNFDVFDESISSLTLNDVLSHIHPEDREAVSAGLEMLKSGKNDEAKFTFRYDDYLHFNHVFSAVVRKYNYDSGELAFIGFMQDVTERELLTDRLVHEKIKAEESENLKSQFLANMSHEIRTPLNAIVGFSDLLGETEDKDERKEFIDIIKKNNSLLLELIDNIIELSKVEAGKAIRKVTDFDMVELINHSVATNKQLNANPDVEILSDLPVDRLMVKLDKTRVNEVVNNFMSNAMKYTYKGHIKLGITLPSQHKMCLFVEDTGVGMKQSDANKVFERFEKLGSFVQGAGLGMAICKAYLKDAGGKIGVKSELGKGSTFWAEYPI